MVEGRRRRMIEGDGTRAREKGRGLIRRAQLRRAPCEVRCASRARSRCLRGSKNTFSDHVSASSPRFFSFIVRASFVLTPPLPLFFSLPTDTSSCTKGINYRTTFPCDRVVSQPPHELHEVRERGWIESDIR